jgi:hypothetical protein
MLASTSKQTAATPPFLPGNTANLNASGSRQTAPPPARTSTHGQASLARWRTPVLTSLSVCVCSLRHTSRPWQAAQAMTLRFACASASAVRSRGPTRCGGGRGYESVVVRGHGAPRGCWAREGNRLILPRHQNGYCCCCCVYLTNQLTVLSSLLIRRAAIRRAAHPCHGGMRHVMVVGRCRSGMHACRDPLR